MTGTYRIADTTAPARWAASRFGRISRKDESPFPPSGLTILDSPSHSGWIQLRMPWLGLGCTV